MCPSRRGDCSPRPSQTRTSPIEASGSSPFRFALVRVDGVMCSMPPRDSLVRNALSASFASMAIRSGFVDTLVGFKAPPCCPRTILKRRSPPFLDRVPLSGVPRRHQYYWGSKTSCAEYEVTYLFASPPQLFASWFNPLQRRQPQGVALLILPHAVGHRRFGRTQDLAGSQGIRAIPLPCSPTPVGPVDLTFTANRCSPHVSEREDTNVYLSRGSITRLQYLLSTLQVVRYRTRMQD